MALSAVHTAMHLEEPKNVHPFFSKSNKTHVQEPPADDITTNLDDTNDDEDDGALDTSPKTSKPRKRRTRKAAYAKNQPSLDKFARRPERSKEVDVKAGGDPLSDATLEEDLNLDRRKRRKTASPKPSGDGAVAEQFAGGSAPDLFQQLQAEAGGTQEVIDDVMFDVPIASTPIGEALESSPPVAERLEEAVPGSSLPQATANGSRSVTPPAGIESVTQTGNEIFLHEAPDESAARSTSKKQIKVTKTGKLVSSPPKKPDAAALTTPKRRGRPRKAAKNTNLSSTITIIKYGQDKASRAILGQKIDTVLNGGKSSAKHVSIALPKPTGPPKPAHPFFTGKAGLKKIEASLEQEAQRRPVTPRRSACTPGKLRAERRKEQDDESTPAFGLSSKEIRLAKRSGLHEPLWPSKETAHVRNLDTDSSTNRPHLPPPATCLTLKPAKLKNNVKALPAEEEIITGLASQLSEDVAIQRNSTDLNFAPPEDVRLPIRLLTTGIDIQDKVRAQIRAPIETLAQRLYAKTHPAITTLYDEIEHTLTPFDEGRCEPQAWAQKYRPLRSDRVLQSGKEAFALRDWLKSLTVLAVGAAQDPSKRNASLDTKKPPKKKRKTAADDFIVFSDEEDEDEDMIELDLNASAAHPSIRRPRWTRNKNVVLLSGPHGCGKSATVYAVAKELDFEVFELHSGVRRSGKDIQDKVGDMTANHLVNHQRGDAPSNPKPALLVMDNDTDNERDLAFQKDLDSGRQGTMTSFFTANPVAKAKLNPKPKVVVVRSPTKTRTIPAAQIMLPIAGASRKSQKQSLILIEEADILFDEDQNFWAQIIKLAGQSKRPIVITCNDELHIPTQALPMAAILRLTSPPIELATDYLVALAGREGHILRRQAIADLYTSKNHDLRASITELNFWCQMSVGDKKGGLEWMYQRWPPGKDVDANGRLLRVASKDTYQSGMGWLSRNVLESKSNVVFDKEEELLTAVWKDWGINLTPRGADDQPKSTHDDCVNNATHKARHHELDRIVAFSDALSASDIYARVDLPSYETIHSQPMDPTLPSIPDKERLNYTVDAPLLQIDPLTDFLGLDTALAITTHILTSRLLRGHVASRDSSAPRPPHPSPEQSYTQHILSHKTASPPYPLSRASFSCLDVLATPSSPFNTHPELDNRSSYNLISTSIDRPFAILTEDIAPYVRSIVGYEQVLESQRIRLGSLLSEGGRGKRARTTKASRTAMEGGERQSKRREHWFHRDLNFELVMRTAGSGWAGMGWKNEVEDGSVIGTHQSESLAGTQRSIDDHDGGMMNDAEAN